MVSPDRYTRPHLQGSPRVSIPANIIRTTFKGHLGSAEEFNWSLWWRVVTPITTNAELETFLDHIHSAWNSHMSHLQANIGLDDGYDSIAGYYYAGGGSTAAFVANVNHSYNGQAATNTVPYYTALVVTLLTGHAGRKYRGRIYVPCCNPAMNSTNHQFDQGVVDDIVQDIHDAIEASTLVAELPEPVVVSSVGTFANTIKSIRGDTKPDVQRRRVNKTTAAYSKSLTI